MRKTIDDVLDRGQKLEGELLWLEMRTLYANSVFIFDALFFGCYGITAQMYRQSHRI